MRYMRWSYADLCDAPAEVVERIADLMVKEYQAQHKNRPQRPNDDGIDIEEG